MGGTEIVTRDLGTLGMPVPVIEQYPTGLGRTLQETDVTGIKLVLPKPVFGGITRSLQSFLESGVLCYLA